MRDLRLFVPSDCVISTTAGENRHALHQMATILKADIRPSGQLDLEKLISSPRQRESMAGAIDP